MIELDVLQRRLDRERQARKRAEALLEEKSLEVYRANQELQEAFRKLESQNARLEEAQAQAILATEAKSEFLANMSHEIRTPMTAILGFAENLLEGDLSESQTRDAVETIRNNGEYLLGIINDILDLSKIESGKMEVEHIPCSPRRIIADVGSLMRVRVEARKLDFSIETLGPIPETIQSDPTRLKQILLNLIGNAVKFTEEGGVRIIVRFVPDETHPVLQFDVLDTGIGMTEEQAANLFEAFSQADTTTTRRFGGTGLGLTISKRFAELLGGELIIVDTKPGFGTRFRVTIGADLTDGAKMIEPYGVATLEKPSEPPRSTTEKPLNCRILLAEDGPDNQRLISFLLEKAGAAVTVVENGCLAVEAALAARSKGKPFDVILMDMQMPVLDGYSATRQLRDKEYNGPIIALTAHAMSSDRAKCIGSGCDDYATKPIDRRKLIHMIEAHLQAAR